MEAERRLLAHVIHSGDVSLLSEVPRGYWQGEEREIVEALLSGLGVSEVEATLSSEARKLWLELLVMGDSASPREVRGWIESIRDRARRRHISLVLRSYAERVEDPFEDPDELVGSLLQDLVRESGEIRLDGREALEEFLRGMKKAPLSLPTGLGDLIHPRKGHYMLVAGRPGSGKTSLLLQLALRWAQDGRRVLFVSLEMAPGEIVGKLLCQVTGMSSVDLYSLSEEEIIRLWEEKLSKLPLDIVGSWGSTVGSIASIVHSIPDLSVLLVDYIQLIRPSRRLGRRWEEIEEISSGLKRLAIMEDVLVVAASQLNREIEREKRSPKLSDLRDSGALEQDADFVVVITRGEEESTRHLHVIKNRYGPLGQIEVMFDGRTFGFF